MAVQSPAEIGTPGRMTPTELLQYLPEVLRRRELRFDHLGTYNHAADNTVVFEWTAPAAGAFESASMRRTKAGASDKTDIDITKNGTSMLSAVMTVAQSGGDGLTATATFSTTTFVRGDVIRFVLKDNEGSGAYGLHVLASAVYMQTA